MSQLGVPVPAMPAGPVQEAATGAVRCWFTKPCSLLCCPAAAAGAMTDAIATLLTRGQAAVEAIQQAPSQAGTAAADAFQELQVIRELLELSSSRQFDRVLQVRQAVKEVWGCRQGTPVHTVWGLVLWGRAGMRHSGRPPVGGHACRCVVTFFLAAFFLAAARRASLVVLHFRRLLPG